MSLLSPTYLKAKLKAKIEPQLHLRVPFTVGIYENSPRWSNKGTYMYLVAFPLREFLP